MGAGAGRLTVKIVCRACRKEDGTVSLEWGGHCAMLAPRLLNLRDVNLPFKLCSLPHRLGPGPTLTQILETHRIRRGRSNRDEDRLGELKEATPHLPRVHYRIHRCH